MYLGVSAVAANPGTMAFKGFEGVSIGILAANAIQTLSIRYAKDFRYWHSPLNREALRKTIAKYKYMWANWPVR